MAMHSTSDTSPRGGGGDGSLDGRTRRWFLAGLSGAIALGTFGPGVAVVVRAQEEEEEEAPPEEWVEPTAPAAEGDEEGVPEPVPEPQPAPMPAPVPPPDLAPVPVVQLGPGASLGGRRPFPDDNPWNLDISRAPLDPASNQLLASIGLDRGLHADFGTVWNGAPNGIPYVVVDGSRARVPVRFEYADESDPGPYPVPADAPIEGGPSSDGDRHVLVIDRDAWKLYELFAAYPENGGARWQAGSGAIFDLSSNDLRPAGWTSADAAGLPIFPGLVRYDEAVEQGAIRHALRFTARRTRRAYVPPARHWASRVTDPAVPPMGLRVRLKASFDVAPFPPPVRVILTAMKTYGMFLADNGSDWYVSGAPDPRWSDDALATLSRVRGRDFEVVRMEGLVAG